MSRKDFKDFLSKKIKNGPPKINWEAEKKDWLSYLDKLYKLFEKTLNEYVRDEKIKITYDEIKIREENIGTYNAKRMNILFGSERITLKPIGTLLIGAKGRVEMSGKIGSVKIVLVDSRMKGMRDHIKISVYDGTQPPVQTTDSRKEKITWEWKFIKAPPTYTYQPVNEDTIYSTIMELSDG